VFASSGAPRDDQCVYAPGRMIRSCTSRPLRRVDIGQYDAGLRQETLERLSNRVMLLPLTDKRLDKYGLSVAP